MAEKPKYSFACLEQDCPRRVCCVRPHVNVTLGDISRWTSQGYLPQILPGIALILPQNEKDTMALETIRKPLKDKPEETSCIFFHEESNGCHIRYSRPLSCRTFPLAYYGEKFHITSKDCPGVGKGEVTKESLKESKDIAEQEYREKNETLATLPGVYTIFMGHIMRQSAEAMKDLSEEDKKRIEEIMSSKEESKPESNEENAREE